MEKRYASCGFHRDSAVQYSVQVQLRGVRATVPPPAEHAAPHDDPHGELRQQGVEWPRVLLFDQNKI